MTKISIAKRIYIHENGEIVTVKLFTNNLYFQRRFALTYLESRREQIPYFEQISQLLIEDLLEIFEFYYEQQL